MTARVISAVVLTCALATPAFAADTPLCGTKTGIPGTFDVQITSSGQQRLYRLHVPDLYRGNEPVPLVLAIHGWGDTPDNFAQYVGFDEKADVEGFVVAYPAGINNSFNAGACCGTASRQGIDDVTFMRDLVADVATSYCIDPSRVFATGFSNGGLMSHRLGCEAADLFAAIAPASGFIAVPACSPFRPVPVVQTQGTVDTSVPYWTGKLSNEQWAEINECGPAEVVYQSGPVTCIAYSDCAQEATVEFCEVQGMGHAWPMNDYLNATDLFWDFFVQHPFP